jgi:hypothetical protein
MRAENSDLPDPMGPIGLGEIKVVNGVMYAKIGESETLHETLRLLHIVDERQI